MPLVKLFLKFTSLIQLFTGTPTHFFMNIYVGKYVACLSTSVKTC